MKKLFKVVLISLIFIGCQENAEKQTKNEKTIEPIKIIEKEETILVAPDEYAIDISATKVGEQKLEVVVTTNFPDGTNLLLRIGRTHYLEGESEKYSGNIFSDDIIVKNGEIEMIVGIDDSGWHSEHLRLVKQLPDDIMPISKISEYIEVSVMFSPARNQPKKVLDLVGELGENLNGKGVSRFGKLTTFKAIKEINFPFKK